MSWADHVWVLQSTHFIDTLTFFLQGIMDCLTGEYDNDSESDLEGMLAQVSGLLNIITYNL